jgi:hypothetical protein
MMHFITTWEKVPFVIKYGKLSIIRRSKTTGSENNNGTGCLSIIIVLLRSSLSNFVFLRPVIRYQSDICEWVSKYGYFKLHI